MTKIIPVEHLKKFAEENDLRQVVLFGVDSFYTQHVMSFGTTTHDSALAAASANFLKTSLDWSPEFQVESPKVLALENQIVQLKLELASLKVTLEEPPKEKFFYLVEMTEYERGWGSRPDGFLVFTTEQKAKAYIETVLAERNNSRLIPPDYYVNYEYIGPKPVCSSKYFQFLRGIEDEECLHWYVNHVKDLLIEVDNEDGL